MASDFEFILEPFSTNCSTILEMAEHVVVGVSPGNSYFNEKLLSGLLKWLRDKFYQIDVVVPDAALAHTYLALGYSSMEARQKAGREIRLLRNRTHRAWQSIGGQRSPDGLHMLSDLIARPAYQALTQQVEDALTHDTALREACLKLSDCVLRGRKPELRPTASQLRQGMRYLVAELPLFLDSTAIFSVGSSLIFYHQPVPLAELIFAGGSTLSAASQQAYAVIRPAATVPRATASASGR